MVYKISQFLMKIRSRAWGEWVHLGSLLCPTLCVSYQAPHAQETGAAYPCPLSPGNTVKTPGQTGIWGLHRVTHMAPHMVTQRREGSLLVDASRWAMCRANVSTGNEPRFPG